MHEKKKKSRKKQIFINQIEKFCSYDRLFYFSGKFFTEM